jgi:hypothetical protein
VLVNKLCFESKSAEALTAARFGGGCALPSEIPWPKSPDGKSLVLCISLSTGFLNEHLGLTYPRGYSVSVFTTYEPGAYFLDLITYHGDPAEKKILDSGYVKVLLHETAPVIRREAACELLIAEMKPNGALEDEVAYQRSKIGGRAHLIQNENLDTGDLRFCLQLAGSDLPEQSRDVFFGEANVAYLYIPRAINEPKEFSGMFFVQCS